MMKTDHVPLLSVSIFSKMSKQFVKIGLSKCKNDIYLTYKILESFEDDSTESDVRSIN